MGAGGGQVVEGWCVDVDVGRAGGTGMCGGEGSKTEGSYDGRERTDPATVSVAA